MQKIILAAAILFTGLNSTAQSCKLALNDGQKLVINVNTWYCPLMGDNKFLKAKEEKQFEQIAAYNARVRSGQEPPAAKYPLTYTVKKQSLAEYDEYTMGTNIAGKDYYSYITCMKDTLFITRNKGVIEVPDGKGGIYGYTFQGIQHLPQTLKVGDVLPTFKDVSIIMPTVTDMTVQKKVFDHYSTSTSHGFGYAPNSNGDIVLGPTIETTTSAVYNTVDVAVRKTVKTTSMVINYMNAQVVAEEEVTINGTKHKAYVIDSESWSKANTDVSFDSEDELVNAQQKAFVEKCQGKVNKLMNRKGFTNSLGYIVIYKTEWFVPTIGMAKVEVYDTFGGIASITTLEGFGN